MRRCFNRLINWNVLSQTILFIRTTKELKSNFLEPVQFESFKAKFTNQVPLVLLILDFIAFVAKINKKKSAQPPHLKAFQIKFRYGGS